VFLDNPIATLERLRPGVPRACPLEVRPSRTLPRG
jgi:hypothetical protein